MLYLFTIYYGAIANNHMSYARILSARKITKKK